MPAHARAGALIAAGGLACFQGNFKAAHAYLEESLIRGHKLEDQQTMAHAEALLGKVAIEQGLPQMARTRAEQSLVLFQREGDRWGSATALVYQGWAHTMMSDFAGGRAQFEESLTIYRALGDQRVILAAMSSLGEVAWLQGDTDRDWSLEPKVYCGFRRSATKLRSRTWEFGVAGDIARDVVVTHRDFERFMQPGVRVPLNLSLPRPRAAAQSRSPAPCRRLRPEAP